MEIDLTGQIGICHHGSTAISRLIEWFTDSHTHHVFVMKSNTECVSAEPGGVVTRPLTHFKRVTLSRYKLTDIDKAGIVAACNSSDKLPYDLAVYPVLALSRLTRLPAPRFVNAWLERRINVTCSQLSAQIYLAAGIRLFDTSVEVATPGDFERLLDLEGFLHPEQLFDLAA